MNTWVEISKAQDLLFTGINNQKIRDALIIRHLVSGEVRSMAELLSVITVSSDHMDDWSRNEDEKLIRGEIFRFHPLQQEFWLKARIRRPNNAWARFKFDGPNYEPSNAIQAVMEADDEDDLDLSVGSDLDDSVEESESARAIYTYKEFNAFDVKILSSDIERITLRKLAVDPIVAVNIGEAQAQENVADQSPPEKKKKRGGGAPPLHNWIGAFAFIVAYVIEYEPSEKDQLREAVKQWASEHEFDPDSSDLGKFLDALWAERKKMYLQQEKRRAARNSLGVKRG